MTQNYSNMSMLEVAENLMLRKKTPQSFKKIAQEVSELMGLSEEDFKQRITHFYSDLTLSGKFVNVGGDKWDLKNRQKFEVYENQFIFDEENDSDSHKSKNDDEEQEEDVDEEDVDDDYEEDYDDGDDGDDA